MPKQIDLFEAIQAKNEGMARAAAHADAVSPGWQEQAYQFLLGFITDHSSPFLTEDVRSAAAVADFPLPPDSRAFGAVIIRAVKAGKIRKIGYDKVKGAQAHQRPATVWIKNK